MQLVNKIPGHPFTKDITGQKFGKIIVESFAGIRECSNKKAALWNCICECGKKKIILGGSLKNGLTKSCGCLNGRKRHLNPRWNGFGEISGSYWKVVRFGAQARNLELNITIQYAWELFLKQDRKCKFSGIELKFKNGGERSDWTASLDRIDSSKGYIEGNCQWIHKKLNTMKLALPDKDFIDWCHRISDFQRSQNLRD